jgi:hypothetical protein
MMYNRSNLGASQGSMESYSWSLAKLMIRRMLGHMIWTAITLLSTALTLSRKVKNIVALLLCKISGHFLTVRSRLE